MDINGLLKGRKCECKREHACPIKYVYIEEQAENRLKEITKDYQNILLVADENTYRVAGNSTEDVVREKVKAKVIFDGSKILIPNEESIKRVQDELNGIDLIIGIGSGVIQDLCKYVSFNNKVPYIIVATAPSMDGYASSGAAMITDGMKVTYTVGLPLAIIANTKVLKDAPMDMIKSGYGDIIGKYSSLNDWKLSREVNGEYFCQYVYDTTFEMINKTISLADGLLKRDQESIKVLMEALIVVGIMISFVGNSRPASGSEHHLSHFFEIVGIVKDQPYLSHGTDVAYSTIVTAEIRQEIVKKPFPKKQYVQDRSERKQKLDKIYGTVSDGCIALQDKLKTYEQDRVTIYREKEDKIRQILSEMPSADTIREILGKVGFDEKDFIAFYGREKIEQAIKYAKDLKDRYTVLWLNYDMYGENNGR